MGFYYLSFCDVTKPAGTQFLGATVVEADDPALVIERANELGINPGGEVAIMALNVGSADELPEDGRAFLNKFIPRDAVMAGGGVTIDELGAEPTASVCQSCNV